MSTEKLKIPNSVLTARSIFMLLNYNINIMFSKILFLLTMNRTLVLYEVAVLSKFRFGTKSKFFGSHSESITYDDGKWSLQMLLSLGTMCFCWRKICNGTYTNTNINMYVSFNNFRAWNFFNPIEKKLFFFNFFSIRKIMPILEWLE